MRSPRSSGRRGAPSAAVRLLIALVAVAVLAMVAAAPVAGAGSTAASASIVDGLSWAQRASMPTTRGYSQAAVATNGKIYAFGGFEYPNYVATVDEYDPVANTWATRAPMPVRKAGPGVVAASNGKIYAIGGSSDGAFLGTVQEYDPLTDTWAIRAPMPTPRFGMAAVGTSDGKIYAIGGVVGNYAVTAAVEMYDPMTDTWAARTPMPTPRGDLGGALGADGKIYAIGGTADNTSALHTVEAYDPLADTWAPRAPMPTARWGLGVVAASTGGIYALGGLNASTGCCTHFADVEKYDALADTWAAQTSLPLAMNSPTVAATGTREIYVLGGESDAGHSSNVYRGTIQASPSPTPSPIPGQQAIAFGAIPDRTYGDAPFIVSATGGASGNPVTFTAGPSGVCASSGPNGATITSVATGRCLVTASQAGNANYDPAASVSQAFAIAKATAPVTLGGLSQVYDGSAKSATATTVPPNLSVSFTYTQGDTPAASPTATGSYAVVATVNDATYQGSASGTLVITPAPSVVIVTASDVTYDGQPYGGTAVATGAGGLSQPLTVSYSGPGYPASTTPPTNAGSYTASASFGGDANHTGSQGSTNFTIGQVPTTLGLTSPANLPLSAQGKVTVSARLTTQGGTPLAGRTVTFSAGSGTATGTTDANGVATAALALPSEKYTLTALFAGDTNYRASQAAAQTVIAYQLTQFVIWGGNAGGVATGKDYQFWGAQWAKQVTGGDYQANNSFKGYAETLSPDGKTWTASPGGSGNPPAKVAPYIGVLVATHATKNGGTISGNVAQIVVLKVDAPASYAPDPGHAGTGVLVATLP